MSVVVGVDDEPSGRDAVALARRLADADEPIVLAGVEVEPCVPLPAALRPAGPTRAALERAVADGCAGCGAQARAELLADRSPARALRALAEREAAGLVVLGSSRRGHGGQAFAGRTARQVLHEAPCAVALAARGLAEGDGALLRRVVVGVDGSPESVAALAAARALAVAHGAALEVVAVADESVHVRRAPFGEVLELAEWDELVEQRRAHAEQVLASALAQAGGAGAPQLDGAVRVGDPPEELARAAARADLLVVGSRHWGAHARVVLGSTSEELLRGAPCSLLLVPRPDGDAP